MKMQLYLQSLLLRLSPGNAIPLLVLMVLIHFPLQLHSQTISPPEHNAPSLQVGLEGLSLTKGTLDAELIMLIVAEKQQEITLKQVQNMFLSKMENSGGAFYSFTDNVVRGIVAERDLNVITKKLLENTVNISFTYAFADFYVKNLTSDKLATFNKLLSLREFETGKQFTNENIKLGLKGLRVLSESPQPEDSKIKKNLASVKAFVEDITEDSESKDARAEIDEKSTELIALIADIASEAIRNDPKLKELGIMQVSYSQSYEYMNKYLQYRKQNTTEFYTVDEVYTDMSQMLSKYTSMIGLLNYHIKAGSFGLNTTNISPAFAKPTNNYTDASISSDLKSASLVLQEVMGRMQAMMHASSDTFKLKKLHTDLKKLAQLQVSLHKASSYYSNNSVLFSSEAQPNELTINSDFVYTLYSGTIPLLTSIAIWDTALLTEIQKLENICRHIELHYKKDIGNPLGSANQIKKIEPFLVILSKAYEFDKAHTFSSSVRLLSEFENVFPNERIKDALAFINTYIRDFVAINENHKGDEYVYINIESLISKLHTVKLDKLKRGSLLFSVGVNSAYFRTPLLLDSDETIRNFSFISEKVGVKVKLVDRYFWKTRNPGETYSIWGRKYTKISPPSEPVVSNYYALLYASGLLYNIVNTGTSSNFNYPLIGTGLGMSFYNSLDLSLTVGVPIFKNAAIDESLKNSYIGLSFDFPFAEYIKRLNEKHRQRQNKKMIAKALN